jgi:hypothetical protein
VLNLPFDKPGRFYRGNLHTHSTRSDGRLEPEAVIAAYRERGYDFLALTDHFMERFGYRVTDTRPLRDETFTTLLGAELHAPSLANGALWHIVAVGLPLDFAPPRPDESGPELAHRAADAGAFLGIAHPAWYGVTPEDALTLDAAHAVEVHNEGHTADSDRGDGWYLSDLLALRGCRIFAYAADDAHFGDRPDHFGGWVQVRAESLDPDTLLAALKAGLYYSSTGPEITDISIVDSVLRVACSPACAIHVVGRGSVARYKHGKDLSEAEFPLDPFLSAYCRVTVTDAQGKRAWSNPIWFDDIPLG